MTLLDDSDDSHKLSIPGFFNHVFNFDGDNKASMLNMIQYIFLGIIPIVLVLKGIKHYIPEEDDVKGTTEITFEVALQLLLIFFAIWFIDRTIRYIPTYSGSNYHRFNELNFVLPLLIILVTMQTKLGAKINILADRAMELWSGQPAQVKGANRMATGIQHQVSRADVLDNGIMRQPAGQMPVQQNISMIDALPNMMNGQGQGQGHQAMQAAFMDSMEPMPANAIGGFGSSLF